jgi:hypothetical protein
MGVSPWSKKTQILFLQLALGVPEIHGNRLLFQTEDAVYAIDIVAVVEDYEDSTFELGQIKEFVEEDKVRLHFFGTTKNNVKQANFKPVYQDRQGRSFFRKEQGATPWLGTINIEDMLMKIEKLIEQNRDSFAALLPSCEQVQHVASSRI